MFRKALVAYLFVGGVMIYFIEGLLFVVAVVAVAFIIRRAWNV